MTKQIMSEDISQLALALSKFQGAVGPIYKSKTGGGGSYKYTYADLADILSTISETLATFELSVSQILTEEEGERVILTILMHSSGQWMRSFIRIPHQEEIQKLGSAITYLRRYCLSSIIGIAAEDDDAQSVQSTKTMEKKNTVPKHPPKKLSSEQIEHLIDLSVQIDDMDFMRRVIAHYEVDSIGDIDPARFNHAVNWLTGKINSKGAPKREYQTA